MANWIKTFMALNVLLIQKTRGRLGYRLGNQVILLLHTVGRKSGKAYVTPLPFFRDKDSYLVVASNWGKDDNPDWLKNLRQHPSSTIQVGSVMIPVEARIANGDEYSRLWKIVTSQNQSYARYQKRLARQIPIVVLEPCPPNTASNGAGVTDLSIS